MGLLEGNCQNCNSHRPLDLRKPCPLCGSRLTRFFGYRYEHEYRELAITALIILGVLLIAVISGVIFLIFVNTKLN